MSLRYTSMNSRKLKLFKSYYKRGCRVLVYWSNRVNILFVSGFFYTDFYNNSMYFSFMLISWPIDIYFIFQLCLRIICIKIKEYRPREKSKSFSM